MLVFEILQMRKLPVLILLILTQLSAFAQTDANVQQLIRNFKNLCQFDDKYPREKVYLHLDNTSYFTGETIWMTAYVMRASSLEPKPVSRVLYVELLDAAGNVLDRKLLNIDAKGMATGYFDIQEPVGGEFYEIRAYTREMSNWGSEACWSRVIPIFETPKEKGDFSNLEINRPESKLDLPERQKREWKFDKGHIEFFPESGARVSGLSQRVAYRVTDGTGHPIQEALTLCDENGLPFAVTTPDRHGMGVFTLPGELVKGQIRNDKGFKSPLPTPDDTARIAMAATVNGDVLTLNLQSVSETPEQVGILVTCREKPCYFDAITLGGEDSNLEYEVEMKTLHEGVNRIDVMDTTGACLATRLVWKAPTTRDLKVTVKQNKTEYSAFEPVALEIEVTTPDGKPVKDAQISVSVKDDDGSVVASDEVTMTTDLLMSSELQGYIPDAQTLTPQEIELLMITGGWRGNSLPVMTGCDSFNLKQPIEDKLLLQGQLFKDNEKRQVLAGYDIDLLMYSPDGGALEGHVRTDKDGRFAMESNVDFTGDWIAQFTTRNDNGKKRWSRIALNRWFDLKPRSWQAQEMVLAAPKPLGESLIKTQTFEWKDTIQRYLSHNLGEAQVKFVKKYKGLRGNRYTYRGGESRGKHYAAKYINVEFALERYKDQGGNNDLIQYFLPVIDSDFRYDDKVIENVSQLQDQTEYREFEPGEGQKTANSPDAMQAALGGMYYYKHKKVPVFLDNQWIGGTATLLNLQDNIWADEIKSVVVMEGRNNWERFLSAQDADGIKAMEDSNHTIFHDAIFLYSRPDHYKFKTKRGVDKRVINGFQAERAFPAPKYNGLDEQKEDDLRRTLYWAPKLTTDADGKATLVFFGNAREVQKLRFSVRGITVDGKFITFEK